MSIFVPVLVTLGISICILIVNAYRKNIDRSKGQIDERAPIDNKAWSLPVVLTSNALDNQFQFPVVFYVLCIILVQINGVSSLALGLAWAYAVLRCAHAFVHITSNSIPARMGTFGLSMIILLVLFILTVVKVLNAL